MANEQEYEDAHYVTDTLNSVALGYTERLSTVAKQAGLVETVSLRLGLARAR